MGRIDANQPPAPSDQTSFQPSQTQPQPTSQGYLNHHENPLSSSLSQPLPDAYVADDDRQSPESMPPPEAYPPPQTPTSYPPQPEPVQFPSQPTSNAQPQVLNYGGATGYQTQYLAQTQGWKNGLFDCADDSENAIITAFFPCVTFGQIADIIDNGQTSCATSGLIYGLIAFIGIPCIMSSLYRTKIRNRYGILEAPAPDWVTHCFFEWCALCQEYRELKARGLDPAIGWQENMIRNQQMQQYPAMTPPMNQTMMG